MAANIVVPPGVTLPLFPCEVIVHPVTEVIRTLPAHMDARHRLRERQDLVIVLKKDNRLAHALTVNLPVFSGAKVDSSRMVAPSDGFIKPVANFTLRMRVTASSIRDLGTRPLLTSCFRVAKNGA
jgi:hypothetical protein